MRSTGLLSGLLYITTSVSSIGQVIDKGFEFSNDVGSSAGVQASLGGGGAVQTAVPMGPKYSGARFHRGALLGGTDPSHDPVLMNATGPSGTEPQGDVTLTDVILNGTWSFTAYCNGQETNLIGGTVYNNDIEYTSGSMRMRLFYSTTGYLGGSISGWAIFTYMFASVLSPGQQYATIDLYSPWTDTPPTGTYYPTLLLEEHYQGQFYIIDYLNFPSVTHNCSVGIEENEENDAVVLYPNPVEDQLTIETEQGVSSSAVELYTMEGRLVRQQSLIQEKMEIDISDLGEGIYTAKVITARGAVLKRFVKN